MPFTFFHPTLVFPAHYFSTKWKKHVSVTGLITGSIAPDFEKFVQMRAGNTYSHTFVGMFEFDLPVSMLLAVIFHSLVKDTLINYLPFTALSNRFLDYKNQNWLLYLQSKYIVVVTSMLIGISSHLILDSATHANGAVVQHLLILSNYYEVLFLDIQGYQLLDISYSIISMIAIYWVISSLPQIQFPRSYRGKKALFWINLIALAALIIYLRLLFDSRIRHVWDLVSLTTAAGLISLFFSCLVWRRAN